MLLTQLTNTISFHSIVIPPLRERKEDIPVLVEQYLNKSDLYKEKEIDFSVWALFKNYSWPGNVRELFSIIERACIISDERIKPEHLPQFMQSFPQSENTEYENGYSHLVSRETDEIIPLETIERRALSHAIRATHGNISLAAKKLGIGRTTFYRKAKVYRILD